MKKLYLTDIFSVAVVIFSSTIYSLGVLWFLEPAGLYAAGITGLAQIVRALLGYANIKLSIGVLTFILNIPIFLMGWKYVSKRFCVYSILSVLVQTVLLLGYIPIVDFGLNPETEKLTYSIIGGLITGFGCGVALKFGTSTGGLDIIGQIVALKKNMTIGAVTMSINFFTAVIGGGFISGDWAITLYTFIRTILSSVVIDKVHTAYNFLTLNIISTKSHDIADVLMKELTRGCTIYQVEGAYTHSQKYDMLMVVSSYELDKAIRLCRSIDDHAFIVVSPVKNLYGNYKKRSII